jgi:hypothetical protein
MLTLPLLEGLYVRWNINALTIECSGSKQAALLCSDVQDCSFRLLLRNTRPFSGIIYPNVHYHKLCQKTLSIYLA